MKYSSLFTNLSIIPALFGLWLLQSGVAHGQEHQTEQLEKLMQGEGHGGLQKAYRDFFKRLNVNEIRALKSHTSNGIALQAAWEEVRRSAIGKNGQELRIDPLVLYRFVGFVEGRLGITLPDWWEQGLLTAGVSRQGMFSFGKPNEPVYHKTGLDFLSPHDTRVEKVNSDIFLRTPQGSLSLPQSLLAETKGLHMPSISGLIYRDRWYVAMHPYGCFPFFLYCIERRSGKTLWKQRVWVGGKGGYEGIHRHWVVLLGRSDHIMVFGAGEDTMYVESFHAEKGCNVFRFSTSY